MSRDTAELAAFDDVWNATPSREHRRGGGRGGVVAFLVVVLLLLLGGGGYTAWALTAPVASPALSVTAPPAPVGERVALALPTQGATMISVEGAEEFLGPDAAGVWAATGGNDVQPLASVTKLVTALVVLEAYPFDGPADNGPTLTFDAADEDLYDKYYAMGSTIAPMPRNSSMTLRDALTAMLVPSASNYAEAVATWAFGSTGSFAARAQDWLARNGLRDTVVVEPTGNSARNVSTPSDLLALARIAAAQQTVASIVAKPVVQAGAAGRVVNTNGLLGSYGVTGLKTGNLGPGTHLLVYRAMLDVGVGAPLTVTGVTTGAESRDSLTASVASLLGSIQAGFHEVSVAEVGRSLGTVTTPWGSDADIVIGRSASILTWSDTPVEVVLDYRDPVEYADGEVIGTLTWTAGPETATADVQISGAIEPPTALWRLTHPETLG